MTMPSKKTSEQTIVLSHNTAKYLLMHYKHLLIDFTQKYNKVVCFTPKDGFESEFADLGIEHREMRIRQHGLNPLREIGLVWQFISLYKEIKPDQVLNFSIKPCLYGGFAAKLSQVERSGYMVTGLGFIFLNPAKWVAALRKLVVTWYQNILREQDILFFQNSDDAELFRELSISKKSQVRVLPGTGIDLDEFSFSEMPGLDSGITFLFIGRMLKDKGLYELSEACSLLKDRGLDFQCKLLGPLDGNPSAIKRAEIGEWEKKGLVQYLSEVGDVKPYIEDCHVFVLPSYREGLPRAGLESMAIGRAVIATDVPGCREIVQEPKNGFLVSVKNAQELSDAMKVMIDNHELLINMGKMSRKICEEDFSVEKVSHIILHAMGASSHSDPLEKVESVS